MKRSYIQKCLLSLKGRKERLAEAVFEELTAHNFPKPMRNVKPQIQEMPQTPKVANRN